MAQYLVEHHGFKRLYLQSAHDDDDSAEELPVDPADKPPSAAITGAGDDSKCVFAMTGDLLDHVTQRWQRRFVTTDLPDEAVVEAYARRPFFLLISIDAPLSVRWGRFQQRRRQLQQAAGQGEEAEPMTLEDFVSHNDEQLYDAARGLQTVMSRATVRLLNTSGSLAHLYATLGKLDLTDADRLRPGWDSYFMDLASLAARRSNCMKRRVGCVLVGPERRVVSTGYNGTPRGLRNCNDGGCPRCNDGSGSGVALSTCLCLHAEENALLEAGRDRIRPGAVLYCDTCPCLTCSIKICQAAISEVVYAYGYSMDNESANVFRQAGVKLRQFVPVGCPHMLAEYPYPRANCPRSPPMASSTSKRWTCTERYLSSLSTRRAVVVLVPPLQSRIAATAPSDSSTVVPRTPLCSARLRADTSYVRGMAEGSVAQRGGMAKPYMGTLGSTAANAPGHVCSGRRQCQQAYHIVEREKGQRQLHLWYAHALGSK